MLELAEVELSYFGAHFSGNVALLLRALQTCECQNCDAIIRISTVRDRRSSEGSSSVLRHNGMLKCSIYDIRGQPPKQCTQQWLTTQPKTRNGKRRQIGYRLQLKRLNVTNAERSHNLTFQNNCEAASAFPPHCTLKQLTITLNPFEAFVAVPLASTSLTVASFSMCPSFSLIFSWLPPSTTLISGRLPPSSSGVSCSDHTPHRPYRYHCHSAKGRSIEP